jgi:hypothetical protein
MDSSEKNPLDLVRDAMSAQDATHHFLGEAVKQAIPENMSPEYLAKLFADTVGILLSAEGVVDPKRLSTIGIGVLSAIATESSFEPISTGAAGVLATHYTQLEDTIRVLPIRVLNEGGPATVAIALASAAPEDVRIEIKRLIAAHEEKTSLEKESAKSEAEEDAAQKKKEEEDALYKFSRTIGRKINKNPNKTYRWLLENLPGDLDAEQRNQALAGSAEEYLIKSVDMASDPNYHPAYLDDARCIFLTSLSSRIASGTVYTDDLRALGIALPGKDVLQDFVKNNPGVLAMPKFFDGWHESLTDLRMNERRRNLPIAKIKEMPGYSKLVESGISAVRVQPESRLGIPYGNVDDLLQDIYDYFVANRANTVTERREAKPTEMAGTQAEDMGPSTKMYDMNSHIFTEEIETPLRNFLNGLEGQVPLEDGTYQFLTSEARRGLSRQYEDLHTSFENHAIGVKVRINHSGYRTYYLDIRDVDHYKGALLDRFAAFTGKQIEYPENIDLRLLIRPIPELPDGFTTDSYGHIVCTDEDEVKKLDTLLSDPKKVKDWWDGMKVSRYEPIGLRAFPFSSVEELLSSVLSMGVEDISVDILRSEFDHNQRRKVYSLARESLHTDVAICKMEQDGQPTYYEIDLPNHDYHIKPSAPLSSKQIEYLRALNSL